MAAIQRQARHLTLGSLAVALIIGLFIGPVVDALQQHRSGDRRRDSTREHLQLVLAKASPALLAHSNNNKLCDPCQEPESDDVTLDRREAAFAMLGTIWAAGALPTALVFPQGASAAYGDDAKIVIPNPIDSMTDRATKQCLVESLGNRECLVYAGDADKLLYKGVDTKILLERIERASTALANIPDLANANKWSQVTGVLTGPLGELIRTMGQLADLSENSALSKDNIKHFKTDLYAISAAVDRKSQAEVIKAHDSATRSLVAFIKSL